MEKAGVETISDHYGVIFAPYTGPVETFVADNIVGIYAGAVTGSGSWLIKAGPEDIAGTTYNGGGLLILTGANTNATTTLQAGTTVQVGYDTNSYTGSVGGTLNIAAGAAVNVVGANEPTGRIAFATVVNNGAMSITGPDRCGEGYFRNNGNITNNNGSAITLVKATLALAVPTNFASTGGGIIDVQDGSTLETSTNSIPASHTLKLAGCGKCNDIGTQDGALLTANNVISATIALQSPVCIDHTGSGITTIAGQITGNHKITLNNQADSTTRAGSFSFTSNTAPFFDNTIEVKNTTLYNTGVNALSKADIVLVENGGFQQDGGVVNLGSLASASPTSLVLLNSSASIVLKENGETTYAGQFANSTPGTPWPLTVEGPSTNKLTLTGAGNSAVTLGCNDGGRIVVQGGYFNWWSSNNGGTISAGTSKTSRLNTIIITALAALDVYAAVPGPGTGLLYVSNLAVLNAGWKVNVMDNLPAGTYNVFQKPNATAYTLPVIGTNASGLTATFANVGNMITMTLA
jgi:hypothetical protein